MSTPHTADPEKQVETKRFIESDAGDGTKREDQYLHGLHLIICFAAVFLCMFLVALDQTIVATILTTVGNKFNDFDKVGWLSSGFLLAMAVFIQPFGKISIIFGRKITMCVAIILFEAGSLMCALAPNMNVLIGGRVLGGIGAAGIQGMAFVIVSEIVPIEKRPLGMAVMSCVFAIASVLGPLVGGAFTTHVTWRWAFYINLPIGGLAFVFLLWAFQPPKSTIDIKKELREFDYIGTFLLIAGCTVFLLALTFGGADYKWNSAAVILCFVLGGLVIIAFIIWSGWFSKNPVIAPEIAKIPQVMAATVCLAGIFSAFIASLIYLSIYFQVIKDATAMGSGLHLLPMIIAVVLCSVSSGIGIQKSKFVKPFSVVAGIIGPIGYGLLAVLDVDSSFAQQVGLLILAGVGVGAQMQPCIMAAQISAPKTPGSTIMVTVFINFSRSYFSALAACIADVVYASSLKNSYKKALEKLTNQEIFQQLEGVDVSTLVSNNSFIGRLSPDARHFVKVQIMKAIRNVFYMSIGFAAISFIACFFITNDKLPDISGRVAPQKAEDNEDSEATEQSDKLQSEVDETDVAENKDAGSLQESVGSADGSSITQKQ